MSQVKTCGDDDTLSRAHLPHHASHLLLRHSRKRAPAGGYGTTFTVGNRSTLVCGDYSRLTAGCDSWLIAGCTSTLTAGDNSKLIGGNYSTLTAGNVSMLIGGYGSTLTAGPGSMLVWRYWEDNRWRSVTAYVGENGIEPDVAYQLDKNHQPVAAKP